MNKVNTILDVIKSLRIGNKVSQELLASTIGAKTGAAYCNKENSKSPLYMDEFINICSCLDIDLSLSYKDGEEVIKIKNNIKSIAAVIKELRENNKLSQDSFRFQLGMSHPNYNKKEQGNAAFELKEFIKIAEILEIEIKINYIEYVTNVDGVKSRMNKEIIL